MESHTSIIDFPDEHNPNMVEVHLDNCRLALANSIRREILNRVRTLAVTKVSIIENTTYIHDEQLIHRFEYLPIRLIEGKHNDSCGKYPVARFEATGDVPGTVTFLNAKEHVQSDTIECVYNSEMNQLFFGQRVVGELHVGMGCGEEDAKFCPVSCITLINADESKGDQSTRWILRYESIGTIEPPEKIFYSSIYSLMERMRELKKDVNELL